MSIFEAFRRAMLGLALIGGLAVLIAAIFLGYCAYTLPLTHPPAEQSSAAIVFAASGGEPIAARGVYRGEKLTADHLPTNLVQAVIAIEDRRFYEHGGIDPRGMLRAAWRNLSGHRGTEGGSTITQQLARLTYLSPERTLRRKVQEAMLALWLESRLSKQEILARYLNAAYFGAGAYGADAAGKRYFDKKAGDLDLAQAAMLAGLIRAPSHLAPTRNPQAAARRMDLVLQTMVETGAIDKPRAEAARTHPPQLSMPPDTEPDDNYFLDTAEAEVKRLIGVPPLDLTVTTTFDPRLQDAAAQTVRNWLGGEGAKRHVGQAALIAMAPDGAILAMVGGRDYAESQFNRATQARRQPGSLFKIFVYLTALSNGYTPDSVMVDQPVEIGDWQPKNYDGQYRGRVTLRTAFAQSLNSIAAQLAQQVGIDRVIATAKSLGVQSELPRVPSLALGSAEVTLLEMTRSVDAIATNSKSIDPYMVRSIKSQTAAPLLYTRPETAAERPDWNWAAMMHLLEAVVTDGTGRAARLDKRSAGKTGTTDEYRDAWFIGFTSDIVVGVWVGNDDNSPMDKVAGGEIPAKIWHDFVVEAGKVIAKPGAPAPVPAPEREPLTGSAKPPPPIPTPAGPVAEDRSGPLPSVLKPAVLTEATPQALRGVPRVLDTGTLLLNGTTVRLSGVEGQGGQPVYDLVRYLSGREVACQPVERDGGQYRCKLGEYDLGEAVVLNGAGRAAANAPERLREAEAKARTAARGIWQQ
jgi:penicillin-binding protein 1A